MSTNNMPRVICTNFCPGGVLGSQESLFCAVCRCHHALHNPGITLHTNTVHYPPTRPPPPTPLPAQPPALQYERVILGESTKETGGRKKPRRIFTPEEKYNLRNFGEKLGWKLSGNDNREIDSFCQTHGMNRLALRRWFSKHMPRNNTSNQSTYVPCYCSEHNDSPRPM